MLRLAILARFLEKADFGLVAIITFVFGMIEMIGDLGFSSAIMHKKDLNKHEFASLYWIQMIVFAVMFLTMAFVAKPIASFYNDSRIAGLLPISLIGLLFLGIGKLYDTVFQKEFRFRIIAIRNIISALLSCIVAVAMAAKGFGVYSLIVSLLFQHAIFNIWNFMVGQKLIKIAFHVSFIEVKDLVKIGIYQTGTQILNYISTQLDVLIIGKLLGMEVLGIYNLAKDLLMKFTSVINSVANRVALPMFSTIQDSLESMRNNYCKMLNLLTSINFPIIAIIGALSYPITVILYGEKFLDTANVIAIFTIVTLLNVVSNPSGIITTAKGRTDLSFICMIVRLITTTPVLLITAYLGFNELLAGKVFLEVILLITVWYFMLWKVIKLPLRRYVETFIVRFAVSTISYVMCFIFIKKMLVSTGSFIQIMLGGFCFGSLYLLMSWVFNKNDLNMLKHTILYASRTIFKR